MVPCYCTFAESAQQERIAQISDYLNDGFSEGLYVGGGPVTVMYQRAMSGTLQIRPLYCGPCAISGDSVEGDGPILS